MKILKQGSEQKLKESLINKRRIKIFECYWCGCIWETDGDKGEVQSSGIGVDYVICPFCKKAVSYEGQKMKVNSFEEELRLNQKQVNQTVGEQKYHFEENGFTEEDLKYEAEMRSQYWSEYMTAWELCWDYYNTDSSCSPPFLKGLFNIDPERTHV